MEYKDPLPIIINPSKLARIRNHYIKTMKNPRDMATAVTYYNAVYEMARKQGNVSVYAENVFMAKALFCGTDKIKRVKAVLAALDLISYREQFHKGKGRSVYYVVINDLWGSEGVISLAVSIQVKEKKDFLFEQFKHDVICTGEDIQAEEVFIDINGCENSTLFVTDIYFNEDEMLSTIVSIDGGSEIEHIFNTDDAAGMIRKVYDYVMEKEKLSTDW